MPHPLPEPLVEVIAERFRVLGEPMRIRILDRLRNGDATIGDLTEALGASQQNVSKHVGVLARAGLVAREKEGNSVRAASPTSPSCDSASRSAEASNGRSPSCRPCSDPGGDLISGRRDHAAGVGGRSYGGAAQKWKRGTGATTPSGVVAR